MASIANDSRFSDPCLANISETGDQSDINSISKTTPSNPLDNNKVMNALLKQITLLHDTNTKICRRLHENKGKLDYQIIENQYKICNAIEFIVRSVQRKSV